MTRLHHDDLRALISSMLYERSDFDAAGAVKYADALLAELARTAKPHEPEGALGDGVLSGQEYETARTAKPEAAVSPGVVDLARLHFAMAEHLNPVGTWDGLTTRLTRAEARVAELEAQLSAVQSSEYVESILAQAKAEERDRYRAILEEMATWLTRHRNLEGAQSIWFRALEILNDA